ncbi:MAG: M20 family metallopeptidase [Actinomycetota bacterium]
MTASTPKDAARDRIEGARDELVDLSHRIHGAPEIGHQEERAAAWLCEALEAGGLEVERGIAGLPTAFAARAGGGPLHVAVCAEYDALPEIGHACGHNVIAAAAVGAGLALARVADEAGLTVTVLGTPAEEGGGGKIVMLENGAFDGVHAALMVHPAPFEVLEFPIIAATSFDVRYTGRAAHSSAFPELGINAADALVVAQTAIGLLRQHIRETDRVHGFVTKGGDAVNVVPADTTGQWMARSTTLRELEDLVPKVLRCFEAGALATGATLEVTRYPPYAEMHNDAELLEAYRVNAEELGRQFPDLGEVVRRATASTDMGNVSLRLPSIHPMLGIDGAGAVNHQPEFAAACVTESADRAVIDGAVAMAWTAIDAAAEGPLRDRLLGSLSG